MFSSALKSFSSNISSNYSISHDVTSTAGPWKIYDAISKKTKKPYSVFVFDRKSLDAHGSSLGRANAAAIKRATEEVVERLKKEASSLARLRHPNVLELVEPVEETRSGLQFVTEAVTASLSSLLAEKDDQERHGGVGGRSSRYVTEEADGTRRRRELEIDELEIQKGLLQVGKALEFLHENAGLVHGNLTPDAILVNAKSDWKLSGLGYSSPPENSTKPTSVQPINLSEALNVDPRLPRFVQLNLNYTSPDFALDNNLAASADMFSLGLLCIALYNSPHQSPIECHGSLSTYKRIFQSPSTVPNKQNDFLSSRPLPRELEFHVLPRLITRRATGRMSAKEFQESEYFDNILVSTIRFLDAFPAKTPNEKAQFMRGLNKVLPSFPKSVMEKKILPALLEELKDKELLSLILQNIFKITELLPSSKRSFGEKVRPRLKEIFVTNAKHAQAQEKDPARDAGLMVVLENMTSVANNCNGAEFKDDILPIVIVAVESPTPAIVDVAMRSLPTVLSILDFSTIKNELFPIIATVFSRTNSLAIKVRGLQAFVFLCGGSNDPSGAADGLDGFDASHKKTSSSSVLDKYTMQEKIVPLIKAIKTKEPAVMMAALNVLRVIGDVADADFVAMDILPILWHMSLGPLLDLKQFQTFMDLIKALSRKVEDEQTKKLQELSMVTNGGHISSAEDFMSFGSIGGPSMDANGATEDDFETLVKGKSGLHSSDPMDAGWDSSSAAPARGASPPSIKPAAAAPPTFSWSTPSPSAAGPSNPPPMGGFGAVKTQHQQPGFRTITPDLAKFESLTPTATQFSQPLQPASTGSSTMSSPHATSTATVNPWASAATANPWASASSSSLSSNAPVSGMAGMSLGSQQRQSSLSSFSIAPPPSVGSSSHVSTPTGSAFSLPPPPGSPPAAPRNPSFGSVSSGWGQTQAPTPTSAFGAMGGQSVNSMNMGMGMGMAAMRPMSSSMNANRPGSMNSIMAGSMGGRGGQRPAQPAQAQAQAQQGNNGTGLDKYESLL